MPLRGHEEPLVSSALHHMAAILSVPDSFLPGKKKKDCQLLQGRKDHISVFFGTPP